MLCWFLLYNIINRLGIYIYPTPRTFVRVILKARIVEFAGFRHQKTKKKKKRNLQVDLATRTFKNVCRASCLREVEGADRACLPGAHGNMAQMKTVPHFQFNVEFFVRIGIP